MGAYLHLGPVITLAPSTTYPCRLYRIMIMFCTDFSKLIEKCFRSWLRSEIESPTSLTYSELFREENRHDWFRLGAVVNSWIKPVCGDFAGRFYLKEARISMESFWVVLNLTCFVYILLPVWVVPFAAGSAQSVERLIAERELAGSIARTGPILRVLK